VVRRGALRIGPPQVNSRFI